MQPTGAEHSIRRLDRKVSSATTEYELSRQRVMDVLLDPEFNADHLGLIAEELRSRRKEDLSTLTPEQQVDIVKACAFNVLPQEELLTRLHESQESGQPLEVKYGIDPTGAQIHLGHAVPMLLLDKFQRMGHSINFVVGDFTAQIGDPSGRVATRPVLTREDIESNMATYSDQVKPVFDVESAARVNNSEWLNDYSLGRLLSIVSKVSVSDLLQRNDFRNRLEGGLGITQAEMLYPVVMAIDSVELNPDIEIGGKDQFLNMQMCRTVMEACGMRPEVTISTDILPGTDGSGAKMSKSLGNYVALNDSPDEIYGKMMSIPDPLMEQYFGMLTELEPTEWKLLQGHMNQRHVNPMMVKKMLAADIAAVLHSPEDADEAAAKFVERFSKRKFLDALDTAPLIEPTDLVESIAAARGESKKEVRRILGQNGIKLILSDGDLLTVSDEESLELIPSDVVGVKVGRAVLRVDRGVEDVRE